MSTFPKFAQYHYRVERELGHNRAGGRVTYLATHLPTQQSVVIKQFQFARTSCWSDYDAYERELQVLKELNHPSIPRYLDSFQTEDGFCMIQEYKHAVPLSGSRSFAPDEIRQIAIAALDVLVYLQARIPPIIHRDIKPENLLIDDAGQVYLVDFGFARVGEGEVGVSSVVKGTLGFMPPEQLFNRQLSEASDLYGLGMTLICLLTGTKSDRIGELVDISYCISFKHLVSKLNSQWVQWLEKMVEPKLKDRFPNAITALAAIPQSPLRPPEAQFNRTTLAIEAQRLGDVLTEIVTIRNPMPDTMLEGHWEVAPHPNDPHPALYRWITVEPSNFAGNHQQCQIIVRTDRLMAGKTYSRKILLHSNALAQTAALNLQIQTARVPIAASMLSYKLLGLLSLVCSVLGWLTSWGVQTLEAGSAALESVSFGAILGSAIGLEGVALLMRSSGWRSGATASTLAAAVVGGAMLMRGLSGSLSSVAGSAVALGAGVGAASGALSALAMGTTIERLLAEGGKKWAAIWIALLTAVLGTSLGLSLGFKLANLGALQLLSITSSVLIVLMLRQQLQRTKAAFTHQSERLLIKP